MPEIKQILQNFFHKTTFSKHATAKHKDEVSQSLSQILVSLALWSVAWKAFLQENQHCSGALRRHHPPVLPNVLQFWLWLSCLHRNMVINAKNANIYFRKISLIFNKFACKIKLKKKKSHNYAFFLQFLQKKTQFTAQPFIKQKKIIQV